MAMLKLVLMACVALSSAFVPLAAPLSVRPVAATPACSGIQMIRAPMPPRPNPSASASCARGRMRALRPRLQVTVTS